jgi:predicted transcriptional regulator
MGFGGDSEEKAMTPKEKILRVMNKLPENASIADAIYRLEFLQSIEEGAAEAEKGLGIDHEEVFRQLMNKNAQNETAVDAQGFTKPSGNKRAHSPGRAKKRRTVHKSA